uniref:Uncharacterized protein n=1 Tax=Theileria annulata TaxID=5874 RepID=A0A3B0MUS0_THEAN
MLNELVVFIYILSKFAICRLDSQDFKVAIESGKNLVERNLSTLKQESNKEVEKYQFNNHDKCVVVKYQNRPFWELEDQYPRALILLDNEVKIECDENCYYKYVYSSGNFKLKSCKKPIEKSKEPPEIKVDCTNYKVFSYYKEEPPLKTIYYFNSMCTEILYNQNTLWKSDGSEYPKSMNYRENKIVLTFDDNIIVYKKEGGIWNSSTTTLFDIDTKSLRGSVDPSDDQNTKNKKDKFLRSETIVDALALVLIISILSMIIVVLILVLSYGFTFLSNKKAKKMTQLAPIEEVMTYH